VAAFLPESRRRGRYEIPWVSSLEIFDLFEGVRWLEIWRLYDFT
jgi:hypothetical protein